PGAGSWCFLNAFDRIVSRPATDAKSRGLRTSWLAGGVEFGSGMVRAAPTVDAEGPTVGAVPCSSAAIQHRGSEEPLSAQRRLISPSASPFDVPGSCRFVGRACRYRCIPQKLRMHKPDDPTH